MFEYIKQEADFSSATNGIDIDTFNDEVWSDAGITTLFHGMAMLYDTISEEYSYKLIFESEPTQAEKDAADVLVTNHEGKEPEPSDLEKQIAESKALIDGSAGDARERYATNSPLQDSVYIGKKDDAERFKAAGYPADETGFEFITAEKNAQGMTATQAADFLLATGSGWKQVAADIEEIRIDYKNQVEAAGDVLTAKSLGFKGRALLDAV